MVQFLRSADGPGAQVYRHDIAGIGLKNVHWAEYQHKKVSVKTLIEWLQDVKFY